MAEVDQLWFIILVVGLATLIFILICIILALLFCRSRRDQRKKKENALKEAETGRKNSNAEELILIERRSLPILNDNSNWFMEERASNDNTSPTSLTRPTAAGDEPFIVGTSLVKYSQQLNRASEQQPTSLNESGESAGQKKNRWGLRSQAHINTETPTEAEKRMVKLGMIPSRPLELNGHLTSSGSEDTLQAIYANPMKAGKRRSKELGPERLHNEGLIPQGNENNLWASGGPPFPSRFALPREDYNTEGITWYSPAPNGLSPSTSFVGPSNYSEYGPSNNVPGTSGSHMAGNTEVVSPSRNAFTTENVEQQGIWQGNATQSKEERLNRIRRIGVPILPD